MAFNAKNLTYDKSEPAFLQRLKAGYASQDGRNNVQHARPGKSRLKMGDGDEDDGPVILDESGEVVGKEAYEGMLKGKLGEEGSKGLEGAKTEDRKEGDALESGGNEGDGGREAQKIVEIGATKKRKAVKVVGVNEDEDDRRPKKVEDDDGSVSTTKDVNTKKTKSDKPKKKAKKIKLSFDEPE